MAIDTQLPCDVVVAGVETVAAVVLAGAAVVGVAVVADVDAVVVAFVAVGTLWAVSTVVVWVAWAAMQPPNNMRLVALAAAVTRRARRAGWRRLRRTLGAGFVSMKPCSVR